MKCHCLERDTDEQGIFDACDPSEAAEMFASREDNRGRERAVRTVVVSWQERDHRLSETYQITAQLVRQYRATRVA